MKAHTTNYTDTFIEIADNCPTVIGKALGLLHFYTQ